MKMKSIYLAGPITGGSYRGATDWRNYFKEEFDAKWYSAGKIEVLSPMRHKDYLLQETKIGDSYDSMIMSSQRGITARDRFDTTNASLVVVNLLGATRVSIGTMIELGWADANNTPIVLVMEKDGSNVHDHAMVREVSPFWVDNIDEAIAVAGRILTP